MFTGSKAGTMCYVLFTLFLFLYGSNGTDHRFKIFRSEHDIFTSLQCSGNDCTKSQCEIYEADCVSDCRYCICNRSEMNTFVRNRHDPREGRCKRDEDIVPESGLYVLVFSRIAWIRMTVQLRVKNYLYNYCNKIKMIWT